MSIKSRIRTIPDFPKKGVMFRDITTLLKDATGFRITLHKLVNRYSGRKIHKVAANRIARFHRRLVPFLRLGRRFCAAPQKRQAAL
ncbi:MAG: hypothetical protein LBU45_05500 [Azoarcus sp.]|nr:hypothetical protein [Azoarcus sp.]